MINNKIKVKDMIYSSMCTALIAALSYISIPLPFSPAPITGQSLAILVIGLVLSPVQAFLSTFIYILLGVIGIPVFAGGAAGMQVLVGPRGGYLIGFMFAAVIISLIRGKKNDFKIFLALSLLIGMPIIYATGLFWMQHVTGFTITKVLKVGMLPFIPGDILKAIAASIIATKLNKNLKF